MDWTYALIMLAAIATGATLFVRLGAPLPLARWETAAVLAGAFCGAMLGAKLPFVLADWPGFLSGAAWLRDGKTIVSGMVGGYAGVMAIEWALRLRVNLGDRFVVPVAAAIGIGRLACFHAGCCHGVETSLPWGVDFGDGVARHPTQLYESAFHLLAAAALFVCLRRGWFYGRLMRVYLVAYFLYRFVSEFVRPEPALWLGLTGYQWSALALAPLFAVWSCPGCRPMRWRGWRRAAELPLVRKPAGADAAVAQASADAPADGVLHATRTVCPICLAAVEGTTLVRDGRVYLTRICPTHGPGEALVSSDRRLYWRRDEVPHPPLDSGRRCCAGPGHRTCVGLLELTEACNLACPVCYAQSGRGEHRRFADLAADLEAFLAERGRLDVLQLSGGEPLLHPEFLKIVDYCARLPIGYLLVNTNGLALAGNDQLASALARHKPRLGLYLQMDGLDAASHIALRGADLLTTKWAALATIAAHQLPTTLVCTVVAGVNENQIGPLLQFGLATPHIRGVVYQPAATSGRFDRAVDPLRRATAADAVHALASQTSGLLAVDDFHPLPCSNPNCCLFAVLLRGSGQPPTPVNRLISYQDHIARLADRVDFNLDDAHALVGPGGSEESFFRVTVKPFMDAHSLDQQRLDECCVHVILPGGRAESFCRYNILHRGRAPGEIPSGECRDGGQAGAPKHNAAGLEILDHVAHRCT